jgi:SEC-C motif
MLDHVLEGAEEFAGPRNWLMRYRERVAPANAAILEELAEIKRRAVREDDQVRASAAWCFEQIAKAQDQYLGAFEEAKAKRFYACWQKLERVEILLAHLERHYVDSANSFGIRTLRGATEKLQTLFPYRSFVSPGFQILEAKCSTCNQKIRLRASCGHKRLDLYNGELCGRLITKFRIDHLALVPRPVQKYSVPFVQDGSSFNYASVFYLASALRSPWFSWKYHLEKRTRPSKEIDHSKYKDTGRNEKCPCGSNQKFKKCCLDKLTIVYDHYQFTFLEQEDADVPGLAPEVFVKGIDDIVAPTRSDAGEGVLAEVSIASGLITMDGTSVMIGHDASELGRAKPGMAARRRAGRRRPRAGAQARRVGAMARGVRDRGRGGAAGRGERADRSLARRVARRVAPRRDADLDGARLRARRPWGGETAAAATRPARGGARTPIGLKTG